jgi:hypothetical protein
MIAHPPCTHLAVSGARWFKEKVHEQLLRRWSSCRKLLDAPIKRIALENPVSIISSRIRKPDQIIQPWQFGHGETKATCLWLKNLPKLALRTSCRGAQIRPAGSMGPDPIAGKIRSRTYEGIAKAMAEQWGADRTTGGGMTIANAKTKKELVKRWGNLKDSPWCVLVNMKGHYVRRTIHTASTKATKR